MTSFWRSEGGWKKFEKTVLKGLPSRPPSNNFIFGGGKIQEPEDSDRMIHERAIQSLKYLMQGAPRDELNMNLPIFREWHEMLSCEKFFQDSGIDYRWLKLGQLRCAREISGCVFVFPSNQRCGKHLPMCSYQNLFSFSEPGHLSDKNSRNTSSNAVDVNIKSSSLAKEGAKNVQQHGGEDSKGGEGRLTPSTEKATVEDKSVTTGITSTQKEGSPAAAQELSIRKSDTQLLSELRESDRQLVLAALDAGGKVVLRWYLHELPERPPTEEEQREILEEKRKQREEDERRRAEAENEDIVCK